MWRHHPVSRLFLVWLNEFGDSVVERATAGWLAGSKDLAFEQEARGRALMAKEAAGVTLEHIRAFYAELLGGVEEQAE